MADSHNNQAERVWASLSRRRNALIQQLEKPDHPSRRRIEEQIVAVEEEMLGAGAPSIDAISTKLQILWKGKWHDGDRDSQIRGQILGELALQSLRMASDYSQARCLFEEWLEERSARGVNKSE